MSSPTASNSSSSHDALMLPVRTWNLLPPRSRASLYATGAPEIYIFEKIRHSGEVPETPPIWLAGSFVCFGEPLDAPCSSGASTLPSSSDHPKPFISLVVISEGSGMRRICCSWARPVTVAVEALASSILRSEDTRSATPNVLLPPPPLLKRNPTDLPQRGLTGSSPTTQPASHRNLIPISKQLRLQPDHPKAPCLLSNVYSHMLNRNEYDDSLLKFLSVTTSWPRHGNVKVRASNPIKLYASSPNSIVLSASLKVKLELEIHLVSWISLVVVRAVSMRFNAKSRHIKPFDTIAVEKDSPASLSMRGESFQVFNLLSSARVKPASLPKFFNRISSGKVKLELEIHLVSWISLVVVRAVSMRFNAKSRHIKPFDTIAVEKDSPASLSMRGESFQVFNLVLNSSKSLSLGYFNVVSDYFKLFRTVVSRIQTKIICEFLYFEQVSLFNTSILCFTVSVVHRTVKFTSGCNH
ncbi:hypothetical protein F2Q69_00024947 [Brassica cretica]|uniref:Uncharacterized protein n=1 Tax=Brassica cretica TaxID=69181 RepID=A0A8S9QP83_BRACR|nr:hypothetical protein F2Q69_00024947 [Brassica cretica]